MQKTIRVIIDSELHKQAKAQAALEGVPLAVWIGAAIEQRLAQPVKRTPRKDKDKPIT